MSDGYMRFAQSSVGGRIAKVLGLPVPPKLRRSFGSGGRGAVVFGGQGKLVEASKAVAARLGYPQAPASKKEKVHAMIFDASALSDVEALAELYEFFKSQIRRLSSNGRAIVLASPPEQCADAQHAIVQRALRGFVLSLGKELRGGSTSWLFEVENEAEANLDGSLEFALSPASAYVDAQTVRISAGAAVKFVETQPLEGQSVLVTGAARGIGKAIASCMAAQGAHVVAVDIPPMHDDLARVAKQIGGTALDLDICADDAVEKLIAAAPNGRFDAIVHNAGITRDKSLAAMPAAMWDQTLAVNLKAPIVITDGLLEAGVLVEGGRVVTVASISGIAGNKGQTNYSASKAGVIGMVDAYTEKLRSKNIAINAVAPGFIETEMTAKIPFGVRQVGRRLCSLQQGGLPEDVAQTIAWLARASSINLRGNVIRVCGQNLLGA